MGSKALYDPAQRVVEHRPQFSRVAVDSIDLGPPVQRRLYGEMEKSQVIKTSTVSCPPIRPFFAGKTTILCLERRPFRGSEGEMAHP